jgi:hypothetical protein
LIEVSQTGLTDEEINDLCEETVPPSDAQCSICLEGFESTAVKLGCDHLFHRTCITRWLREHTTCPICRTQFGRNNTTHRHINVLLPYNIIINLMYPNNTMLETHWTSENTLLDIFIYLRRQFQDQKIYLYFDNLTFSTNESFDHLNQTLRNFRIIGENNVMVRLM